MIPNHVLLLPSQKNLSYLEVPFIEEILRNKMRQYMHADVLSSFTFKMFYCESNQNIVRQVIDNTLFLQESYQLKQHKHFENISFYWDYLESSSKIKYLQKRLKNGRLEGFYLFIITAET